MPFPVVVWVTDETAASSGLLVVSSGVVEISLIPRGALKGVELPGATLSVTFGVALDEEFDSMIWFNRGYYMSVYMIYISVTLATCLKSLSGLRCMNSCMGPMEGQSGLTGFERIKS